MLLTPDRAAYLGKVGMWSSRAVHGSLNVYVSLTGTFTVAIDGRAGQSAEVAVVPAFVPHRVVSSRPLGIVQLENETFDPERLPVSLREPGARRDPALRDRMRQAFAQLLAGDPAADPRTVDIDMLFFGSSIARRQFDPRIAPVVERVRQRNSPVLDAMTGAHLAGISSSRFRSLFKSEVGTTFKRFRAWKRARSVLTHITSRPKLSDLALELGFSDSTHFSHSIRGFWGLRPRDLFTDSRRLSVVVRSPAAFAAQDGQGVGRKEVTGVSFVPR
jgi:AraC-like DNA-binding protein